MPEQAKSSALVIEDSEARGVYVHWIVVNLSVSEARAGKRRVYRSVSEKQKVEKKEGKLIMRSGKRFVAVLLAVLATAGVAEAQARVTERVEAMIAENSPLKLKDNDLWVMLGGPLVYGIQYDKYATANVALGFGVGSFVDGVSVDMQIKYFFLPGRFSPFITVGPVFYYERPTQNVFAINGGVGLSYYFDEGLGLSLAFVYTKAVSKSPEPFSAQYVNDKMEWPAPQFGLHLNF